MTFPITPSLSVTGAEIGWILTSYFIGCFTAGYYWTRWKTGRDIRASGSGNVGARNVGRALGRGGFAVTLLLDAAKGALAVLGGSWIGLGAEAIVASIVAVVVGHNWPVQLRFRGGKGVAVSLGALLAYDPFIVLALFAVFLPVIAVLRNLTLSGMIAFALAPLFTLLSRAPKADVAAASIVAILVLLTHRRNIREEIARITAARPVAESPSQLHNNSHDEA
jgi:glycerol-3-phosphate acyltransferase PlsY